MSQEIPSCWLASGTGSNAALRISLPPELSCRAILDGIPSLVVIDLHHTSGASAYRVLDEAGNRLADSVSDLSSPTKAVLRAGVLRYCLAFSAGLSHSNAANLAERFLLARLLADLDSDSVLRLGDLLADEWLSGIDRLSPLSVVIMDGELVVERADGLLLPLFKDGRRLLPGDVVYGWTAVELGRVLAPFFVLGFRHRDGATAAWIFDRNLSFLGDMLGLPDDADQLILEAAAHLSYRHVRAILQPDRIVAEPEVAAYLKIDAEIREQFARRAIRLNRLHGRSLGIEDISHGIVLPIDEEGRILTLPRDAILCTLRQMPLPLMIDALRRGSLPCWPSPYNGEFAELRDVIVFSEMLFCYRFCDSKGFDFHIVCGGRELVVFGMYIAQAEIIVCEFHANYLDDRVRGAAGCNFWELLPIHAARFAEFLDPERRSSVVKVVNVLPSGGTSLHIGHFLWNDLSGIEYAVAALGAERSPTTIVIGGRNGSKELFGPLDQLFPELVNHLNRRIDSVSDFIEFCYRHGQCPTRLTWHRVSLALQTRIRRFVSGSSPSIATVISTAPTIILGLRTEDRTVTDHVEFYGRLLEHLSEAYPGCIVVFDGYNAAPGEADGVVIKGLAHKFARVPPHQVEAELVAAMRIRFLDRPIEIVDTIARPVAESLQWCLVADAAIAIWGAGLAKYRWCANLPTLSLSGRNNLLNRTDLHIYDDPHIMDQPAVMLFPEPDRMQDVILHDRPADYPDGAFRENFVPDIDHVLSLVDQLMQFIMSSSTYRT